MIHDITKPRWNGKFSPVILGGQKFYIVETCKKNSQGRYIFIGRGKNDQIPNTIIAFSET